MAAHDRADWLKALDFRQDVFIPAIAGLVALLFAWLVLIGWDWETARPTKYWIFKFWRWLRTRKIFQWRNDWNVMP